MARIFVAILCRMLVWLWWRVSDFKRSFLREFFAKHWSQASLKSLARTCRHVSMGLGRWLVGWWVCLSILLLKVLMIAFDGTCNASSLINLAFVGVFISSIPIVWTGTSKKFLFVRRRWLALLLPIFLVASLLDLGASLHVGVVIHAQLILLWRTAAVMLL